MARGTRGLRSSPKRQVEKRLPVTAPPPAAPVWVVADEPIALEMAQATLRFGASAGVFGLNFSIPQGTILGMIGPSGCGKTTALRLFNGIYRPQQGHVMVLGKEPHRFTRADKARVGYIPQHFILYPNLSVEENLHFLGGIYNLPRSQRRTRIDTLLEFVELSEARHRLGKQLSGGMQRRLMLAGALLHEPQILFADEPTAGIDPILRARIWDNFRALRDQGHTLLVTTQYVGEAAFCDQVAVLRVGRLLALDTPEALRCQAMGGDMLRLLVDESAIFKVMALLEQLPGVLAARRIIEPDGAVTPGALSVTVDQAGLRLPRLLAALQQHLEISPYRLEQYIPPFDEVFVRLIQHSESTAPDDDADEAEAPALIDANSERLP